MYGGILLDIMLSILIQAVTEWIKRYSSKRGSYVVCGDSEALFFLLLLQTVCMLVVWDGKNKKQKK